MKKESQIMVQICHICCPKIGHAQLTDVKCSLLSAQLTVNDLYFCHWIHLQGFFFMVLMVFFIGTLVSLEFFFLSTLFMNYNEDKFEVFPSQTLATSSFSLYSGSLAQRILTRVERQGHKQHLQPMKFIAFIFL